MFIEQFGSFFFWNRLIKKKKTNIYRIKETEEIPYEIACCSMSMILNFGTE